MRRSINVAALCVIAIREVFYMRIALRRCRSGYGKGVKRDSLVESSLRRKEASSPSLGSNCSTSRVHPLPLGQVPQLFAA
jgi:hypothetical protein